MVVQIKLSVLKPYINKDSGSLTRSLLLHKLLVLFDHVQELRLLSVIRVIFKSSAGIIVN